jgi:hypothetical protein
MIEFDTYNYEHLVEKCVIPEAQRKILFDFYERLFACCGDMSDFHEKNTFNKSTRQLADLVSELSDSIKTELWRELERQGLDIVYEKEELDIRRNNEGEIIS